MYVFFIILKINVLNTVLNNNVLNAKKNDITNILNIIKGIKCYCFFFY